MSEANNSSSPFGGIGRALSTPNYRTYWIGQIVMVQGFWIYKIASGWLMYELTKSPIWLGALGSAYLLPIFFLGPFGGAVADRFGYRRSAITMGGLGAVIALLTAIVTWSGLITPVLLLLFTGIQGLLFAFEFPARQSLYPNLLPRKNLSAAVALNATTFHTSAFTGPLLGGVLLTTSGAGAGFAANAFCMAWMMVAIFMISTPKNLSDRLAAKKATGILNDLKDGLRYTLDHIDIRLLIVLTTVLSLLLRPYLDFLPGFAGDVFNRDEEGLATLTAASGIGASVFATYLAIRGRTSGLTGYMNMGLIGAAIALILFALSTNFNFGLVTLALLGGMLVSASICVQTLLQHTVDDEYRARVISINVSLAVGAPAISAPIIGWMAEIFGLQYAVAGSAALALICVLPIGLKLFTRRKEIEADNIFVET
ncbi:MAG: MFS transporter [Rhodospirillaceae bacterium]|nr:MFS transporter [Rhodospirillaceae bacterium]MBT4588003.1 MFS transporter [Rhodospirillaceae bacterium]MBT4938460.1 MFS transporter [Rhodospirillaceae bacterium]